MRNCEGKLSGWARGCPRCPHRCFCHPLPPAWVLGRQRSKAVNIKFKKVRKKGGKKPNQNKKKHNQATRFPRGWKKRPRERPCSWREAVMVPGGRVLGPPLGARGRWDLGRVLRRRFGKVGVTGWGLSSSRPPPGSAQMGCFGSEMEEPGGCS